MICTLAGAAPDSLRESFGPRYSPSPHATKPQEKGRQRVDAIRRWNQVSIDATGADHAGAREQLGPGRASRAMAMAHIAIFDAVNAVVGGYESYSGVEAPKGAVSAESAVSQAAHDTLVALFPAQTAKLDSFLAEDLAEVKDHKEKTRGILLGQQVAAAVLSMRANDGAEHPEPRVGMEWLTSDQAGHWRQDPISLVPLALGAHWGECVPFVVESSSQFRCPPPPAMTSPEYARAFNEVKRVGGDGVTTTTERTADQTQTGIFWAYDGTPSLCAPPRLYNQITVRIADQAGTEGIELARLLVLVNVAMSDATLTCWESKYHYDVWRPITGIREADASTGPSGTGDGNAATAGDPGWMPLGAPASNLTGPNFTPPFPAYPSGHASMGGALFQMLRRFYGTDRIAFTFVSDEFNGVTRANDGTVRPVISRSFSSLSQAEEENGQSRIYLGIHWSFDKTRGISLGNQVADYVFNNAFRPLHGHGR
ncbi:MAG: Chloride peroxidase [Verrucomicrobiales bacterium]|nr:Chloride peroxidase [Verrucomicrobiales bacterium]